MRQKLEREFQKCSVYKQDFLIQDFVQWKGITNQSEWKGTGPSGCWTMPVDSWVVTTPSPCKSWGTNSALLGPALLLLPLNLQQRSFLKRGLHGPGSPQGQLRPDLLCLLLGHLKIWSSRKSPAEPLGKTGNRLWPERDVNLFWKISWLLVTWWHWV